MSIMSQAAVSDSVQEIPLNRSIRMLSPSIEGIDMILKTWVDESDARSRFEIRVFTLLRSPAALAGYYADVGVFDGEQRITPIEQESADCSVSQTAFFSYETANGPIIEMVTAQRIEGTGLAIPVQTNPRPQQLRLYLLRHNVNSTPGKPRLWFQMVSERQTNAAMCDSNAVHSAMTEFVEHR